MTTLPLNQILHGDSVERLRELPDNSIDMVVTSPPYDDIRYYSEEFTEAFDRTVDDYDGDDDSEDFDDGVREQSELSDSEWVAGDDDGFDDFGDEDIQDDGGEDVEWDDEAGGYDEDYIDADE